MTDQQQPAYGGAPEPLSPASDVQLASFAHLGGILFFPPSLIIWLVFKDRGRFTAVEAKEALNFQITILIGAVALAIVTGILGAIFGAIPFIGWVFAMLFGLLNWAPWIISVVFSIIAFLQVKDGKHYRYPFAIRLIK
ncbi:DUF4870 domain-containing protein [Agromyces seonyuensis]|uniref:DUF4870 domain-containing protein n=1 Tax=Agromyces seonyuensis TaxID=2662446 RepID=A0A6I4NZP8_9MICO|nr:DUF4870 domain-containing protein [Agromyces seonyuensis]MWB99796.1 DUF4870 domain-containing protein [Agromyces seonyuensis]